MAAEGDHIRRYNYTDGRVPHDATHVTIDQSVTVIRQRAFCGHPNIVEVICHEDVERIANMAFAHCSSLRRVIMPGVEVVEGSAFFYCRVLTDRCSMRQAGNNQRMCIPFLLLSDEHHPAIRQSC